MSPPEVDMLLNTQSGLLGISGLTHDMRELPEARVEYGARNFRDKGVFQGR